jgi:acyl carrier protein
MENNMNEDELLAKVTQVVVDKLGVKAEDVKLDSSFVNDLGADSLDRVELVMALEDEFDIEILDEDAEKFIKVSDVLAYVKSKVSA